MPRGLESGSFQAFGAGLAFLDRPKDAEALATAKDQLSKLGTVRYIGFRVEDLHSLFADLDPPVFLNADPDPVVQNCSVTLNFVKKNYLMKSLL